MSRGETRKTHPSYGIISFHRAQVHDMVLFGSSIRQNNIITLEIYEAEDTRDLNRHWYHSRRKLIEIVLSPTQFTDAITAMNSGGVPCTIRYKDYEYVDPCPYENVRKTFQEEFKSDIQKVLGRTQKVMKMVEEKLKAPGTLKKADRVKMAEHLYHIEQDIRANMPFVQQQFDKQMDQTVTEAKGEIEAFFSSTIHALGSEKLIELLETGEIKHPMIED